MSKRRVVIRRSDRNQPEIKNAAESVGASWADTHTLGDGFPDAIVGFRGVNYMIEIKDYSQPPSKRRLTDDEKAWHSKWCGQVAMIETVNDLYMLIGAI